MAADSFGTKNQPQFSDNGAVDLAVDSNALADYSAKVGNRRVGTTAERNAATGKDLWEGLEWWDTTVGGVYRYIAGRWQYFGRLPTWTPVTPPNAGAYVDQNEPLSFWSDGVLATLQGTIWLQNSSARWGIEGIAICNPLPVAVRPHFFASLLAESAGATLQVGISTAGEVSVQRIIAGTPGQYMRVFHSPWPIKRT